MTVNAQDAPTRRIPWVELALLTALTVAVRLVGINQSLWLDELITTWVALSPDGAMSERAAAWNAATPYYWLVRASITCFGTAEWAVRLPSLVFGCAVPLVVYSLARSVTGSVWGARLAGGLAALDGLTAAAAADARPYPLIQFFGALHLLAFWLLLNGGSWRWRLVFVATALGLGYTQFTGLTIIAGEMAFFALLLARREPPAYRASRFAFDLVVCGLLLLPLVPLIREIAGRKANFELMPAPAWLDSLVLAHRQVVYLILPAVAAAIVRFARPGPAEQGGRDVSRPAHFLLIVFYGTAVPLWLFHRATGTPVFQPRYTTILFLLPMVAAGLCVSVWPGRAARVVFACAALVLGQVTDGVFRRDLGANGSPRLRNEDWREAIAWVNERGGGRASPVFVRSGLIETDGYLVSPTRADYLTLPVRAVYPLAPADRPVRSLTYSGDVYSDADLELIRSSAETWFIVKGDEALADGVARRATEKLARAGVTVAVEDRKAWRNVVAFRLVQTR